MEDISQEQQTSLIPHNPQRVLLGRTLLILGLVGWIGLVIYIVQVRYPSVWVLAAALFSWILFFVGKTLLKAKQPDK